MKGQEIANRKRQLTDLYTAFNDRDIPTLLTAMTSDVLWPNGSEGGTLRGHDEVRAYWTRQWEQIEPTVVPTAFRTDSDGRIAVTVQQVVRDKAGVAFANQTVTHVYRFVDDLVAQMESHLRNGVVTSALIRVRPTAAARSSAAGRASASASRSGTRGAALEAPHLLDLAFGVLP